MKGSVPNEELSVLSFADGLKSALATWHERSSLTQLNKTALCGDQIGAWPVMLSGVRWALGLVKAGVKACVIQCLIASGENEMEGVVGGYAVTTGGEGTDT